MTVVIGIQVDEDADTPVVAVWYGGTVARTGWTLIHHSGHDVVFWGYVFPSYMCDE